MYAKENKLNKKTKEIQSKVFDLLFNSSPFLKELENPNNKPPNIVIKPNNGSIMLPIQIPSINRNRAKI